MNKWFINRKTHIKFLISFGLFVFLLASSLLTAYLIIHNIHEMQKTQLEKDFALTVELEDCRAHINRVRADILQSLLTTDSSQQDALLQDIQDRQTMIDENMQKLQIIAQSDADFANRLSKLKALLDTYRKTRNEQVLPLIHEGKLEEAKAIALGVQDEAYNKFREQTIDLGEAAKTESNNLMIQTTQNILFATRLFVFIAAVSLLLSIVFVLVLNRIIANPLRRLSLIAAKISAGDTSIRVPFTDRWDEIGTFSQALSQMIQILQEKVFYARNLIEVSLDPMVTISPEGMITDVNETTITATGTPRDKLLGTEFYGIFTNPERARAGFQRVFEQGTVMNYPLTIRHSSGTLMDVLYNASVYKDQKGNIQGVFAAARDITAQKKIQQEIQEGVNILGSSTSEILMAASQVASGAAETAAAVNETTSTVEEVKQTAQVTNQKAKYVAESSQKTVQTSQAGKKAVKDSLDGMNHIREQMESIAEYILQLSEQSQTIGEIIAVVNDLADQSNLLAVNASIEAAKAGEQGKGFSVVAQEVRRLAEQSKQATAQVRTILNNIVKSVNQAVMATEQGSKAVDSGMKFAESSGEVIRLLAESVNEAYQAATQIAASNQQQLAGVDQVALAMENINQVSVQNVSSTKQVEIAAQNLNTLGQKLKQLVLLYEV